MLSDDMTISRSQSKRKRKPGSRSIKSTLRSQLRRYPLAETWIMKLWYPAKYSFWKSKWSFERIIGSQRGVADRGIDTDKVFMVNPQDIVYCSMREFSLQEFKGHILGGDWDLLQKPFEQLDLYQAIIIVCVNGMSWTETAFYQRTAEDIRQGHVHYGCHNESEFIEHCSNIENLYQEIKDHGYKSQSELFITGQIANPLVADQEVAVCIGRSGDLLFSDGAHRLAIAKILRLPEIPVKITVRHKEWIRFRDELVLYSRDGKASKLPILYQPITHLDLSELPAAHESANRFELIKNNTVFSEGRLVDLGASLGYFCHRFENLGFDCVAIENDPQAAYFLKKLKRAENKKFAIINDSLLDCPYIRNTHFNISLALNIFHHFLKTREDFDKLVDLLNHLQTDELFFEPHLEDEQQMENAHKNYSPDDFVKFIIDNSSLNAYQLIGTMQDGRPIYKLYHSN